MNPDDPMAALWRELGQYGVVNPADQQEEDDLVHKLASSLITPVQYVGESLGKLGTATRGAISSGLKGDVAGVGKQLLNAIPFSDWMGLTSEHGLLGKNALLQEKDKVSGRDLIEQMGYEKNTPGLDLGDVLGFGVDVATDPLSYVGSGVTKFGKALKDAGILSDAATQARRAGHAVAGQSEARHVLTPRAMLAAAEEGGDTKFLNAFFKGKPDGRTMADIPQEALDESVGGLFNFMGHTVRGRPVAKALDQVIGKLRYGNPIGRAANNLFDRGHTGGSRFEQEFLTPNQRLHLQQEGDLLNPDIAHIKGKVADSQETLANANPHQAQPDAVNRVWQVFEGTGPDPTGIHPEYQAVAAKMKARQNAAGIPTTELSDEVSDIAFRRMLDRPDENLDKLRRPYTKNTPGGTPDIREVMKAKGYALEEAQKAGKTLSNEEMADILRRHSPDLGTYDTLEAKQAAANLEKLKNSLAKKQYAAGEVVSPAEQQAVTKQIADLEEIVRSGSNQDRYSALAGSMNDQSIESLKAGGYMDPMSSLELVGQSHVKKVANSRAFQDALHQPDQWQGIMNSAKNQNMLPLEKAAESLGLDPTMLKGLPDQIPEALVKIFKPKPVVPPATGPLADMAGKLKDWTNITKAHLTGTILNPSFPTRNRGSGWATSAIQGDMTPLAALKDFFQTFLGTSDAQRMAKGQAIPGAASKPWVRAAAEKFGVDLTGKNVPKLPPRPEGFVRVVHISDPSIAPLIREHGLDYSKQGMISSTTGLLDDFNDLAKIDDSRFMNGIANIFDVPMADYRMHNDVVRSPGILPWKYLIAQHPVAASRAAGDDAIATNLIRSIHASASGGPQGQHLAENLMEDLTGVGDFVGGRVGPQGPDAYSAGKVLNEAKGMFTQNPWEGLVGVAGVGERTKPTSATIKAGSTLNDYVENQNRIAPWLDMVQRGIDPAEAMRRVTKSQVSYSPKDYTDFENNIARYIFPFYKFLKGSSANVAHELTQKPGGGLSRFLQTSGQLNDRDTILPDYVNKKAAIPIGKLPLGLDKLLGVPEGADFQRFVTSLGFQHEDPLSFVTGERGGMPFNVQTLQEGLGRLNPMAKALGELATGQSFFQRDVTGGRPMQDMDPPIGRLAQNIKEMFGGEKTDPRKLSLGPTIEALVSNSPLAGYISDAKTITDQQDKTGIKQALNFATGLKLSDVHDAGVDARLSKLIDEMRRKLPGSKVRTDVYVPEDRRANFNPNEAQTYDELRQLDRFIQKRQRKSKKKDPLDLEALLSL